MPSESGLGSDEGGIAVAVATGVTDIRVQLTLFSNRKVKRLRRALGSDGVLALIQLWCYIASNEPDGFMLGWSAEDVEAAASWDGDPLVFFRQCVECGLVDELEAGGYCIHDWAENQPFAANAVERSERSRAAATIRWERYRNANGMRTECDPHADTNADLKNGNAPPSLPPNQPPKPTKTRPRAVAVLYRWDEFAALYPEKGMTYDSAGKTWWGKNVRKGDDSLVDSILAGVRRWNAGEWHRKGIVANCGKFLREGVYGKPVDGGSAPPPQDDIFAGAL
ncbi:MAG: hypothetical protein KDC10_14560 [Calditrichaeota bacterium]|nr:hypothetical protein [Calditrichota bacterium]